MVAVKVLESVDIMECYGCQFDNPEGISFRGKCGRPLTQPVRLAAIETHRILSIVNSAGIKSLTQMSSLLMPVDLIWSIPPGFCWNGRSNTKIP